MRFLQIDEVVELHRLLIEQSGGMPGIRELSGLESALAQPQMTFGGIDLYPTLASKAAAIGFSLIANHPFFDGNKRVGHAALETMLVLNGFELQADVDEQEAIILQVAAGGMNREKFTEWVETHIVPLA